MERLPATLTWTKASDRELAAHELTVIDAFGVFLTGPRFFRQKSAPEITERGVYRIRPERFRMVGPTPSNRMLTFVLEIPDLDGASHIVTGWDSTLDEIARYDEAV